jgi:hypothetical protein
MARNLFSKRFRAGKLPVVLIDLHTSFHALSATRPFFGETPGLSIRAGHGIPLM